jgi:hypothetical protein
MTLTFENRCDMLFTFLVTEVTSWFTLFATRRLSVDESSELDSLPGGERQETG